VLVFLIFDLWILSFFVMVYPALFVYSSSIISETFFTVLLFVLFVVLKNIVKGDLHKNVHVLLSGFVFGFLIFFARFTRSFGVIILPAFILSGVFFYVLKRIHEPKAASNEDAAQGVVSIDKLSDNRWKIPKYLHRNLLYFILITSGVYFLFDFLAHALIYPPAGLYKTESYIRAFALFISRPWHTLSIVQNQLVTFFVSQFWILPFFFIRETYRSLRSRNYEDIISRFFLLFLLIGAFVLTVLHQIQVVERNNQYLLFSRYLDPIYVVLFVYSVRDFFHSLVSHSRHTVHAAWIAITAYLVWYLYFNFYYGWYKFGNNMPIYYLRVFKESLFNFALLVSLIGGMWYFFLQKKYQFVLIAFVILFTWHSYLSIIATRAVPRYVAKLYAPKLDMWQNSFKNGYSDTPLCVYKSEITHELYYLYHFQYPYQYLKKCDEFDKQKPKKIIVGLEHSNGLPVSCGVQFTFDSGESVYYCPLGIYETNRNNTLFQRGKVSSLGY
ncbi:MAG: hypothetical protein AAB893_03760, partial [Patescibacteria group bacterium]